MPRRTSVLCLLTACCVACSAGDSDSQTAAQSAAAPAESTAQSSAGPQATTYDAAALLEWTHNGDANWQVVGDAVQADSGSGFLVTHEAYRDFALTAEFWVTPDANSGIFIRCADPDQIGADTCYEINIFDQRPDPAYRTGGIVNVAEPTSVLHTGGRWNRYEITASGPRLVVTLNDQMVVDVEDERFAEGPIALQYGAGTVLFRNIEISTP